MKKENKQLPSMILFMPIRGQKALRFPPLPELFSQAHFDEALVGDIVPIGLSPDAVQECHRHPQGDRFCGKFEVRHGDPHRFGQIQMVGAG